MLDAIRGDTTLVVGTPSSSPLIARLGWSEDLARQGREGYVIRSTRVGTHSVTVIASQADVGALYGAFHFLRLLQTGQPVARSTSPSARGWAAAAEPLGQPGRLDRARLRGPIALAVGRAARPRGSARRATTPAPTPRSASTAPSSTASTPNPKSLTPAYIAKAAAIARTCSGRTASGSTCRPTSPRRE